MGEPLALPVSSLFVCFFHERFSLRLSWAFLEGSTLRATCFHCLCPKYARACRATRRFMMGSQHFYPVFPAKDVARRF